MIVKMRKISLVLLESETDRALEELRRLGVLHVETSSEGSERLERLQERLSRLQRAQRSLDGYDVAPASDAPRLRPGDLLDRLDELDSEEERLVEERERLQRERDRLSFWGDFDPDDLRLLNEYGLSARLYLLTRDELRAIPPEAPVFEVARRGSLTGVVSFAAEPFADIQEFELPAASLSAVEEELERRRARLDSIERERAALAGHMPLIEKTIAATGEEIELEQARVSMGVDGALSHITGYVPSERVDTVAAAARTSGWAMVARDPAPDDPTPTLVRNPKPISIIKPVFTMLGTIPGYREYDISFFFLLFFTLFFAMIIGDAGYGFVFLAGTLATVVLGKRKGRPVGLEQALLLVLSVATIVWGALTGTWFGSEAIARAAPFRFFVFEPIATFNPRSGENVKFFCFVVGTVQIVIAHLWNFTTGLRSRPRIRAFGQIGWLVMILGIYYLVLNLVLDPALYPLPDFALWLIVGGLGGVVLFSEQEGNFLKGIGKGFAGLLTTFLDSIGAFADIISYIRLFAVGLATVEIAKSFNGMASDMGGSIVGIVGSILILALGHTLNLAMGALSVVVHGVRLNMLEFSGHLGMEWTGIAYNPLRRHTEETQLQVES